ncbi:MAG TPA: GNAT family N-acetyltransferase [Candidatus Sulfotelmatobacter sp.]|nr:GNAT family N-acetyltransferase [Candidatus Sulfotelmatobacter sp.]
MTLASDPAAPTIERLRPAHLPELLRWLQRDPVLHVYLTALALRDSLAAPHDETWAARRLGEIVGVLHLGGRSGAVLPHGGDPEAFRQLAEVARARRVALPPRLQVIGPARAVEIFVEEFARDGLAPRLFRRQIYLALEPSRLPVRERLPALRPARPEDYAIVYESGAALRHEELDEDPRVADPRGYPRRVEEECRDGHTWLWIEDGVLRFRASISAATADAAQVSGVYTPPALRGRGYATRGLSELCTRLLARSRNACLFVNDFNAPALSLYRRLGFREIAAWASAFFDPAAG